MKNLKLFLLLFVALASASTFTACSDDDNNQSQNQGPGIVGTWTCYAEGEPTTLTFNADGTFVETYHSGTEHDYGTYSYDGTTLTLVYSDGYQLRLPATLSGDELTIEDATFVRV